MENPQSVQSAMQDKVIKLDAERHFRRFWTQILKRNANGLLNEIENGKKVFSFETYLREIGEAEYIKAYCSHTKANDFASTMMTTNRTRWSIRIVGSLNILMFFLVAILPGICLYLLIVAFLATFDISFWGWLPAILFALTGPGMVAIVIIQHLIKSSLEAKAVRGNVLYIVKYFDNDELTFLRTKNKLFVEGQ